MVLALKLHVLSSECLKNFVHYGNELKLIIGGKLIIMLLTFDICIFHLLLFNILMRGHTLTNSNISLSHTNSQTCVQHLANQSFIVSKTAVGKNKSQPRNKQSTLRRPVLQSIQTVSNASVDVVYTVHLNFMHEPYVRKKGIVKFSQMSNALCIASRALLVKC